MVNSVTFSTSVGGDGSTVTDDDNITTGLGNGGHLLHFVPCLQNVVAITGTAVTKAGEALASANEAAATAVAVKAISTATATAAATAATAAATAAAATSATGSATSATAAATSATNATASTTAAAGSATNAMAAAVAAAASAANANGTVNTPDIADVSGNLQGETGYYLPAGAEGATNLVHSLGLFVFSSTATDPVDGETCIAPVSGGGRWLLICPSWNFVYAWLEGQDLSVLSNDMITANASIATVTTKTAANTTNITALNARILSASASLDFPSIAATTGSATLTITVTGAAVGDRVTLAPPSTLPAGLIPVGYVSATDTVSITLFNNTAGAIDPVAMGWSVTIIKGA